MSDILTEKNCPNPAYFPYVTGHNAQKRQKHTSVQHSHLSDRTVPTPPETRGNGECLTVRNGEQRCESGCKTVIILTRIINFKPVFIGGSGSVALLRC